MVMSETQALFHGNRPPRPPAASSRQVVFVPLIRRPAISAAGHWQNPLPSATPQPAARSDGEAAKFAADDVHFFATNPAADDDIADTAAAAALSGDEEGRTTKAPIPAVNACKLVPKNADRASRMAGTDATAPSDR
jgi:hypothetical protein